MSRERNAVIKGISKNRGQYCSEEMWMLGRPNRKSLEKMYVGVFNQSKMATSSRADYNGTVLLDIVFVFL